MHHLSSVKLNFNELPVGYKETISRKLLPPAPPPHLMNHKCRATNLFPETKNQGLIEIYRFTLSLQFVPI